MIKMLKNKSLLNIIGIILLVLVVSLLGYFLVDNLMTIEKQDIYTSFAAGDHLGFDLNKTALTFGMVVPGGSGSRSMNFSNDHDMRAKVVIRAKGEIADYLIVSENDFILEPGEEKEVGFVVYPPKNISFGLYEGQVDIVLRRILR